MIVETDRLVTVKQYAELNSVTPQQVYNWINNEQCICVKIAGFKFIKLEDEIINSFADSERN